MENGYYWIKASGDNVWEVAQHLGGWFYRTGTDVPIRQDYENAQGQRVLQVGPKIEPPAEV